MDNEEMKTEFYIQEQELYLKLQMSPRLSQSERKYQLNQFKINTSKRFERFAAEWTSKNEDFEKVTDLKSSPKPKAESKKLIRKQEINILHLIENPQVLDSNIKEYSKYVSGAPQTWIKLVTSEVWENQASQFEKLLKNILNEYQQKVLANPDIKQLYFNAFKKGHKNLMQVIVDCGLFYFELQEFQNLIKREEEEKLLFILNSFKTQQKQTKVLDNDEENKQSKESFEAQNLFGFDLLQFLNSLDKVQQTPLYVSISKKQTRLFEKLLELECDLDVICSFDLKRKGVVLHHAAQSYEKTFVKSILEAYKKRNIDFLSKKTSPEENNALHLACSNKDEEMIFLLLEYGFSLNEPKNKEGKTPIQLFQGKLPPSLQSFLDSREKNSTNANVASKLKKEKKSTNANTASKSKKKTSQKKSQSPKVQKLPTDNLNPDISKEGQVGPALSATKETHQEEEEEAAEAIDHREFLPSKSNDQNSIMKEKLIKKAEQVEKQQTLSEEMSDITEIEEVYEDEEEKKAFGGIKDDFSKLKNLLWEIALSQDAMKSLKQLVFPLKKAAINKLMFLGMGYRSSKSMKDLKGFSNLTLYEAYLPRDYRIIWQIEIDFSQNIKMFTDIIRVWDIVKHTDVQHVLNRLNQKLKTVDPKASVSRKSLKIISKCQNSSSYREPNIYQELDSETNLLNNEFVEIEVTQKLTNEIHKWNNNYILEKFYSLSLEILGSFLDTSPLENSEYQFRISKEEFDILQKNENIILIGRSGTGKTSCALVKLWSLYKAFKDKTDPESPLLQYKDKTINYRQMFLVVNQNLCNHVKKFFTGLQHSHGYLQSPNNFVNTLINFKNIPETQFPLILTFSNFIQYLDATLENPFFSEEKETPAQQERKIQLDETTLGWEEFQEDADFDKTIFQKNSSKHIMNFSFYMQKIWHDLIKSKPKEFREKYSPSLVYVEIISFIKGSDTSLDTPNGYLSCEEYEDIGRKKSPMFRGNRKEIYELFLEYERIKKRLNVYDQGDVIFHIYKELKTNGYSGDPFHFITVDEVQDLTQAQLKLLFLICDSKDKAFLFSGDTAQTIERGIGFRFCDLRSLFYFENERKTPEISQLTANFRSHSGILNLASSIVDLIEFFFPDSIDKLARDYGLCTGPKPVMIKTKTIEELVLLLAGNENNNQIEFGSHQVIIVRNEESKKTLPKELQSFLVMTPIEVKGLEFEDVFVYNFFKDSPPDSNWSAIHEYREMNNLNKEKIPHFTPFNLEKHKILCSELKTLYMVVTRAKKHLWFFDESSFREPFEFLWAENNLIDIATDTHFLKELGDSVLKATSKKDWQKVGKQMFDMRRYSIAEICFKQSGNSQYKEISSAYHIATYTNSNLHEMASKESKKQFIKAAKLFEKNERFFEAAKCYYSGQEFISAGLQYEKASNYSLEAAQCFEKGKRYDLAAKNYEKIKDYEKVLDCLEKGKLFEEAIEYFQVWEKEIILKQITNFTAFMRKCIDKSIQNKNDELLRKYLSFLEREEQTKVLKQFGKWKLEVSLLESWGEFEKMAKVLKDNFEFSAAGKVYNEKLKNREQASKCYLEQFRFKMQEYKTNEEEDFFKEAKEALEAACLLVPKKNEDQLLEIKIQFTILTNDLQLAYQCCVASKENKNYFGEMRSLESFADILKQMKDQPKPLEFQQYFQIHERYITSLKDVFEFFNDIKQGKLIPLRRRKILEKFLKIENYFNLHYYKIKLNNPLLNSGYLASITKKHLPSDCTYYLIEENQVIEGVLQYLISKIIDELSYCFYYITEELKKHSVCFSATLNKCEHKPCPKSHSLGIESTKMKLELLYRRFTICHKFNYVITQWSNYLSNQFPKKTLLSKIRRSKEDIINEVFPLNRISVNMKYLDYWLSRNEFPNDLRYGLWELVNYLWEQEGQTLNNPQTDVCIRIISTLIFICNHPTFCRDLLAGIEKKNFRFPTNGFVHDGQGNFSSIHRHLIECFQSFVDKSFLWSITHGLQYLTLCNQQKCLPKVDNLINIMERIVVCYLCVHHKEFTIPESMYFRYRVQTFLVDKIHLSKAQDLKDGQMKRIHYFLNLILTQLSYENLNRYILFQALLLCKVWNINVKYGELKLDYLKNLLKDYGFIPFHPFDILFRSEQKWDILLVEFLKTKSDNILTIRESKNQLLPINSINSESKPTQFFTKKDNLPSLNLDINEEFKKKISKLTPNQLGWKGKIKSNDLLKSIFKLDNNELDANDNDEAQSQSNKKLKEQTPPIALNNNSDTQSTSSTQKPPPAPTKTKKPKYPVRVGKLNCEHFMKYGICGYGQACEYNHPLDRLSLLTNTSKYDRKLEELDKKRKDINNKLIACDYVISNLQLKKPIGVPELRSLDLNFANIEEDVKQKRVALQNELDILNKKERALQKKLNPNKDEQKSHKREEIEKEKKEKEIEKDDQFELNELETLEISQETRQTKEEEIFYRIKRNIAARKIWKRWKQWKIQEKEVKMKKIKGEEFLKQLINEFVDFSKKEFYCYPCKLPFSSKEEIDSHNLKNEKHSEEEKHFLTCCVEIERILEKRKIIGENLIDAFLNEEIDRHLELEEKMKVLCDSHLAKALKVKNWKDFNDLLINVISKQL